MFKLKSVEKVSSCKASEINQASFFKNLVWGSTLLPAESEGSAHYDYFHSIPTKSITNKFTIISDLSQFLQPGLISYSRFEEKLGAQN